jgi:hypothetical protein
MQVRCSIFLGAIFLVGFFSAAKAVSVTAIRAAAQAVASHGFIIRFLGIA